MYKEALDVMREATPFVGSLGRVCTHPCEAECERGKIDEPLSIRCLHRFVADYELNKGRPKATPMAAKGMLLIMINGLRSDS